MFERILGIWRHLKLFKESPKVFVIYAHGSKAKQEAVKEFIQWFKDVRFDIHSDQSPCGYGPSVIRAGNANADTSLAARNILENQLCVLPQKAFTNSAKFVILCGTNILAEYMNKSQFNSFVEAMVDSFSQLGHTQKSDKDTRERVRNVSAFYSEAMQEDFHHVQTELALLNVRYKEDSNQFIIPLLLNGDYKECFPKYIVDDKTTLRIELNDQRSPHKCFFRLLGLVAADQKLFIDALRKSYETCSRVLDDKGSQWDSNTFRQYCETENLKALMELTNDQDPRMDHRPIEIGSIWVALREYYSSGHLSIQRVSGQAFPIDLSYINLTLVQSKSSMSNEENQSFPEAGPPQTPIPLDGLFKERILKDGSKGRPKRILIRGQPGVGKSTICKRIVTEYQQNEALREEFDWVLWVPLSRLELTEDLEDFFYKEYFQLTDRGRELAQTLYSRILGQDKAKTLLILDGFDETHGWAPGKADLVARLANHDAVIITSRFSGWPGERIVPIDLELEALGFSQETVSNYLENRTIVPSQETADEIKGFIDSNESVLELVKLPIYLDALCYSWDELKRKTQFGSIPTVTILYQTIMTKLWRKDIPYLQKRDAVDGSPLTQEIVQAVRDPRRLEHVVHREIEFLGRLALELTEQNRTNFGNSEIDEIIHQTELHGTRLPLSFEFNLNKLSLLHLSGPVSKANYNFIHLTFQEFIAAQWLIQDPDRLDLYIRQFKYNPRFENVWRFVTGLFHSSGDEEQLLRFFDTIEKDPRDLLGPVYQQLIMNCLSDAPRSQKLAKFTRLEIELEDQLSQWLWFECNYMGSSRLAGRLEFPEQVIEDSLQKSPDDMRIRILHSLCSRPKVSQRIIRLAASWLGDNVSTEFILGVVYFLRDCPGDLPDDILPTLTGLLKDPDSRVIEGAVDALERLPALTEEILRNFTELLTRPEPSVPEIGGNALKRQAALPEGILQTLTELLKHQGWGVPHIAAQILQRQAALPEKIRQSLTELLRGPIKNISISAAIALQGQRAALPEDILQTWIKWLKDPNSEVRENVAWALRQQMTLPEGIIQTITEFLKDSNLDTPDSVYDALRQQRALPDEVLQTLITLLRDPDWRVRYHAIQSLQAQASLTKETLQIFVKLFENPNREVREFAHHILRNQAVLPEEVLQTLAGLLQSPSEDILIMATTALQLKAALPVGILQACTELLKHPDWEVHHGAAQVLQRRVALPEEILQTFTGLLKSPSQHTLISAMTALRGQSALPDGILQTLTEFLKVPNWELGGPAASIIQQQAALPEGVLQTIATLLKDPDWVVRCNTVRALAMQTALPEEILQTLGELLEDSSEQVSDEALKILGRQAILPDEKFCSLHIDMASMSFTRLYEMWLKRAFEEHLIWHMNEESFQIDIQSECWNYSQGDFLNAVQEVQRSLGMPVVHGSGGWYNA
ncbi:hypothetical protein N7457_004098 [Penicillium paradoxum]|uniref:uncharacterized protein n=1 Tax=Penicillium paradoxum TaxID=176176 RepID=UPI002548DCDC|nr:uncharacterized protein N7457_004098 [Penicillium paradoxum]KAJ5782324.1 hypothetical protein N7457_004098 [Penicillium paradoxum]